MHEDPVGGNCRSGIWFVTVGCTAATVHWTTVVALVELAALPPLRANLLGWLAALGVSFAGHHRLTFSGHGEAWTRSAVRFVAVSGAGFAINELAYAALLHWSGRRYDVVLAIVLVAVAFVTWWLSRRWVFRRKVPTPAP
ncbi:MAG: GtrA family protein [Caldimonas sp.]